MAASNATRGTDPAGSRASDPESGGTDPGGNDPGGTDGAGPAAGAQAGYERLVRQAQRDGRIPAVQVAVHRSDRPLWTFEVGSAGTDRPPLGPDSQFRIGSITKTFTAVLAMQCRDEGLLDLDDPVSAHLDVPAHGELTIRRLMSHTAGLQREPAGDIWDTLDVPDTGQLVAELVHAERVLPPARRLHYSNLAVAVLGQLVGGKRGGTWAEVLTDRILRPLGLSATTVLPTERAVAGYLVDAYSDHVRPEPAVDMRAVSPAAQLWSTATDMARWAAFLTDPTTLDPDGSVLAVATVEEMRYPLVVTDESLWAAGFGLGPILVPQGDRIMHVGHDGAMPGFLASAYGRYGEDTPPALAAAALGSAGNGDAVLELTHTLLEKAAESDPADIEPWAPGPAAPPEYRSILGRWWSEGFEFVFSWHDGRLEARGAAAPTGRPPAVFGPEGTDVLRTVSGREAGERLRLTRDSDGRVVEMHWATYRLTRDQQTFERVSASEP